MKNSKGKVVGLKPNVTYKSGEFDYLYRTDSVGRIDTVDVADLKKSGTSRANHNPNTLGKQPGDHAGHLIADRFGGSPEIDNLISQLSNDNLSAYKKLENQWVKAIDAGQKVEIKIDLNYNGSDLKPNQYIVDFIINGVPDRRVFNN